MSTYVIVLAYIFKGKLITQNVEWIKCLKVHSSKLVFLEQNKNLPTGEDNWNVNSRKRVPFPVTMCIIKAFEASDERTSTLPWFRVIESWFNPTSKQLIHLSSSPLTADCSLLNSNFVLVSCQFWQVLYYEFESHFLFCLLHLYSWIGKFVILNNAPSTCTS